MQNLVSLSPKLNWKWFKNFENEIVLEKRVLLNRAPTSTQLHSPPPTTTQLISTSTQLHPAHFSLHPPLCNTLNNIWTKILHVIGQFPQI